MTVMTAKVTALALALLGTIVTQAFAEQVAAQPNLSEVKVENYRGKPFYEVLMMNRNAEGPGGVGNYYNSLAYVYDEPDAEVDARFLALDGEKLAKEYGADGARFNGPRRFVANWGIVMAMDDGKKFMMGTIPTRILGTFDAPNYEAFMSGKQEPYHEMISRRTFSLGFNAGEEVYELVSPEGAVFTMFSSSLRIDPDNTMERLPTLGERLTLPDGWKYRVRTLEKDLVLSGTYDSDPPNSIVLDQFENNYQRNRVSY